MRRATRTQPQQQPRKLTFAQILHGRHARAGAKSGSRARVPASFVRFCKEWARVSLTEAQEVAALVAFDGVEPRTLEGPRRELAREMFGDVDEVPPNARAIFVAVCGARGGKSYVFIALRMLHLALTVRLDALAPGESAVAAIIGPKLRHAQHVLRYVRGVVRAEPRLAALVVRDTAERIELKRESGQVVAIECLPAAKGGEAGRGRSLVGAALDESAFFYSDAHVVNDVEVYRAVAPRVLRGGQVVVASTPWAESGLLFDFWRRNHGQPQDAIVAHAPTLLLRDNEDTRAFVDRERARDPLNAEREFDAKFLPLGGDAFFNPRAVDEAVDDSLELPLFEPPEDAIVTAGGDFGFRSDSSALALVHRQRSAYTVARLLELRPDSEPLKFSETVAMFADATIAGGAESIMADMHYREAISEHLRLHDLSLEDAPAGAAGKAATYQVARSVLHEGRLRLPNHQRLIEQLKEVRVRPLPGGGVSIQSPRSAAGGHGDLVSALVLAVYAAHQRYVAPELPPAPEPGTPEWLAREQERMEELAEQRVKAANRRRRRGRR